MQWKTGLSQINKQIFGKQILSYSTVQFEWVRKTTPLPLNCQCCTDNKDQLCLCLLWVCFCVNGVFAYWCMTHSSSSNSSSSLYKEFFRSFAWRGTCRDISYMRRQLSFTLCRRWREEGKLTHSTHSYPVWCVHAMITRTEQVRILVVIRIIKWIQPWGSGEQIETLVTVN